MEKILTNSQNDISTLNTELSIIISYYKLTKYNSMFSVRLYLEDNMLEEITIPVKNLISVNAYIIDTNNLYIVYESKYEKRYLNSKSLDKLCIAFISNNTGEVVHDYTINLDEEIAIQVEDDFEFDDDERLENK